LSQYLTLSPDERQRIADLRRSGLTGEAIARAIGRSKSVVYKYYPEQKPKPRWSERDKSVLAYGYLKGWGIKAIASRIGRSELAVRLAMCRHRQRIRADPLKLRAAHFIGKALAAGLTPGQAINAVRRADILRRCSDDL
jgi:hypothetical protein